MDFDDSRELDKSKSQQLLLNASLNQYQSQSDLLNSIEKFILNLSVDENSFDNILLIENNNENKQLQEEDFQELLKDLNDSHTFSDKENDNSDLNMAMYEESDNDQSYLDQIEKILDGIENQKSMRGTVTILQPKNNKVTQQKIIFEKEKEHIKINKIQKNFSCSIF